MPRFEFVLKANGRLIKGTHLCIFGDIKGIKNDMARKICESYGTYWPDETDSTQDTFFKMN